MKDKKNTRSGLMNVLLTIVAVTSFISCDTPQENLLHIREQGSFAVGGSVITNPGTFDAIKRTPEGQTFHGDHAYVFYQIPENARTLPLVLLHGFGQFSKTWETTPDGREGFQNIFLRQGFSTYLMDQPRRGNAGRSTVEATITPAPDEQFWFNVFRIGVWPDYFPGVQFSKDPEALNQYFRQMTPNIGPFDSQVITDASSALADKIGPLILVTHSHPGGQILFITEGKGYYQALGQPARLLHKGDVVEIPRNVVHWHGAAPDSEFAHIAISLNTDEGGAVWSGPVTDEEYNNLKLTIQ